MYRVKVFSYYVRIILDLSCSDHVCAWTLSREQTGRKKITANLLGLSTLAFVY